MSGRHDAIRWATLALFCALLFLAGNGAFTVVDRDEARFALAVREMAERGDAILPTNFGEPRYHKPILIYWLALASGALFGPGEFALRLPSALCGTLTVLVTAAAGRDWLGRRPGWRAGLVLATALFFVIESKVCTADASLLLSTTLSFWAWGRLRRGEGRPRLWQAVFWTGVGLGLLAKVVNVGFLAFAGCALAYLRADWTGRQRLAFWGLIAAGAVGAATQRAGPLGPAVLAGLVLFFFVRSVRDPEGRAAWERLGWRWGAPLALGIALLWVVPALVTTRGAFLTEGLGHHLLARTARPFEGHGGPPGYYVVATLIALFPWGALLPGTLAGLRGRLGDDTLAYLAAWVGGPWVGLELLSSKLPHYLLVAFPALALLIAARWERTEAGSAQLAPALRWAEAALFVVPALAVAAGLLWLAWSLRAGAPAGPLAATGAVAFAYAVAGGVDLGRPPSRRRFAPLVAGAAALHLAAALVALPAVESIRIAQPLAAAVARQLRAGERVWLFGETDASLGYYLPGSPGIVGDATHLASLLRAPSGGSLAVVAAGRDGLPLDERLRPSLPPVAPLERVRGIVFPDFRPREVWLVRGLAGPGPEPAGGRPAGR